MHFYMYLLKFKSKSEEQSGNLYFYICIIYAIDAQADFEKSQIMIERKYIVSEIKIHCKQKKNIK